MAGRDYKLGAERKAFEREREGLSITPNLKDRARKAPESLRRIIAENNLPQFVKLQSLRKDLKVVPFGSSMPPPPKKEENQVITEFSFRSRMKLASTAKNAEADWQSMLTLTYPQDFPTDGRKVKKNLNALLTKFRAKFEGKLYLWWLEFQRRGAPHYHILTEVEIPEPRIVRKRRGGGEYHTNKDLHDWVSKAWYRTVDSGDPKHLLAGCAWEALKSEDGGARYAAAYAAKMYQKTCPDEYTGVGRFWGASRGVKADVREEILIPTWEWLESEGIESLQFMAYDSAWKISNFSTGRHSG